FSAWQEVSHIGVKPMFIYRPFRTGLKGFYVGFYPSIGWQIEERIRWDYDGASNINSIETQIGIGINIGNKWIFNNGFTLQLGTGIGRSLIISQGSSLGGDFRFFSDGRLSLRNLDIHILDLKFGVSF
ncbi:MAG: hypothetical protein FWC97_03065, partial [Treponema sp.]|nr:hypothetical protein [Treponema sp.]